MGWEIANNIEDAVYALKLSSIEHFGIELDKNKIAERLSASEVHTIYKDNELAGAAYFSDTGFHIGMIKKYIGHGLPIIRKLIKNRNVNIVIDANNKKTIKLAEYLGFRYKRIEDKYIYMVKP